MITAQNLQDRFLDDMVKAITVFAHDCQNEYSQANIARSLKRFFDNEWFDSLKTHDPKLAKLLAQHFSYQVYSLVEDHGYVLGKFLLELPNVITAYVHNLLNNQVIFIAEIRRNQIIANIIQNLHHIIVPTSRKKLLKEQNS